MPSHTNKLRRFFMPQVDQLEASVVYDGLGGVLASSEGGPGRGWLAVYGIGDNCLVDSHDFVIQQDFELEEHPSDCLCVSSVSRSTLEHTPHAPRDARPEGNVIVFAQQDEVVRASLHAGDHIRATSICFTREFFGRDEQARKLDYDLLCERIGLVDPDLINDDLRNIMRGVDLRSVGSSASSRRIERGARMVLERLLEWIDEESRATRDGLTWDDVRLVGEVTRIIDANPGRAPTVGELSRLTHVGHTHLCATFKRVTGETVGGYARRRRLEEAQRLLAATNEPLAAIARVVGYATPAAFSTAFHRSTGVTPSAWRKRQRA